MDTSIWISEDRTCCYDDCDNPRPTTILTPADNFGPPFFFWAHPSCCRRNEGSEPAYKPLRALKVLELMLTRTDDRWPKKIRDYCFGDHCRDPHCCMHAHRREMRPKGKHLNLPDWMAIEDAAFRVLTEKREQEFQSRQAELQAHLMSR